LTPAEIGVKAGRVIGRYKMAKHFQLQIADNAFGWCRDAAAIGREEQLDGIYVIRTSESLTDFAAADCVRTYKQLALVEQAFRCLKGLDLRVRPIHHRVEPRVRAHLFLCLLAYYVEWQLRRAWQPLLYEDEELEEARWARDPVKPARPSAPALRRARDLARARQRRQRPEQGAPRRPQPAGRLAEGSDGQLARVPAALAGERCR